MLTIELPDRKFRLSCGATLTAQEARREHTRLLSDYTRKLSRLEFWKTHGTWGDGKPQEAWRELFATYRNLRELARLMAGGN
jgi:hypothetical protein